MARNTLSFFSRLFSSKKKKILEKKEKEQSRNEVNIIDDQKVNDSEKLQASIQQGLNTNFDVNNKKIEFSVTNRTSDSQTNDQKHQEYKSRNDQEALSFGHAEFSSQSVSTAEEVQSEIGLNVEVAKTNSENIADHKKLEDTVSEIPNDAAHDDALEYDSMVLLSKLEQLMIKISDNSVQKSIPLMMEALVDMANCLMDFSDQLAKLGQRRVILQELLGHDEQNYKVLNSSYVDKERLSISPSSVMENPNTKEIYSDISNDLLRLINVYLSASVKAFKSNQVSEQWKTLYTGFFVSLTKVVRSSQTNHQG